LNENILTKYRWPSVLKGWERGILLFSKAQFQSLKRTKLPSSNKLDDIQNKSPMELLQLVTTLPNTKVVIVHGTKDFVVPLRNSQSLAQKFNIPLIELEGQGHDPFEEKVDEFVAAVESVFEEDGIK